MKWWRMFAQRRAKYCRQDEALCTVCLTKRLAGEYFGERCSEVRDLFFSSTSEVSTADFKLQLAEDETYKKFVEAVNTLKNDNGNQLEVTVNPVPKLQEIQKNWNVDGDWLFEESFSAQNLKSYYGVSEEAQIQQQKALERATDFVET